MKRIAAASHWVFLVFAGLVVLGLLGTACRQLIGIDDRSTGGCGLGLPNGDCTSCVASECCSAAENCGASPACKQIEQCYARCAGNPTCTLGCGNPPGSVPAFATLEACIGTHCASACAMSCDERPGYAGPDGGEACRQCLETKTCTEQSACGTSPSCLSVTACVRSCATVDCAEACLATDQAGATVLETLTQGQTACAAECALGQSWACVGHVVWPQPTTAENTLAFRVQDAVSGEAIPSLHVSLCSGPLDPTCAAPLGSGTADDAGAVVLPYTVDIRHGGYGGFAQMTGDAIPLTQFWWGFPLSEQHANLDAVKGLTTSSVKNAFAYAKVTPVAGHGAVGIQILDCTFAKADAVRIALTPSDAETRIFYFDSNAFLGFNPDASATDLSGVVLASNVPAGPVSLTATSEITGQVVARTSFLVPDGGLSEVWTLPTP